MMALGCAERNHPHLMDTQPSSSQHDLPTILSGPWTADARQRAFECEVSTHYVEYYRRAVTQRNWSPWHNLPIEEMQQLGSRLSSTSADLIEGFLGIEEYVGDYVQTGLNLFRQDRTRRNAQLQWGAEEARHSVAWELVLKHSHARTDAQLETYMKKAHAGVWDVRQHADMDNPLGVTIYSMIQERATHFHYQKMRLRIREEYGLSLTPTSQEQARGFEVGASEAFRLVALDEIAHHGLFLRIVQSAIKYFPAQTFEILVRVVRGFKMPALHLIPNVRTYIRAVRQADFYSPEIHEQEIYQPILRAIGLESHVALERAVAAASQLPVDLAPESLSLKRTGEWCIEGQGSN